MQVTNELARTLPSTASSYSAGWKVPENAVIGFQWKIQSVNQSIGCDPFILCCVLRVSQDQKSREGFSPLNFPDGFCYKYRSLFYFLVCHRKGGPTCGLVLSDAAVSHSPVSLSVHGCISCQDVPPLSIYVCVSLGVAG